MKKHRLLTGLNREACAVGRTRRVLVASAIAGLTFAACSGSSVPAGSSSPTAPGSSPAISSSPSAPDSSAAAQPVTLTVQAQSPAAVEAVGKEFSRAYPNVTVKVVQITDAQKTTTNAQLLASDDAPDVGIVPINAAPYLQLLQAKQLVPLDDVWQAADLQKRYGDQVANSLKSSGTPYLAAFDSVYYNIGYYNVDAFKKAGVALPQNHQFESNQVLLDAAASLKAAGYDLLAVDGGSGNGYKYGWMLDGLLAVNATPDALQSYMTAWQTGSPQAFEYTDSNFVDSLQQLSSWQDSGVFAPGSVGAQQDASLGAFSAGKAAMFLGGVWSVPDMEKAAEGFAFDWVLLPGLNKPALPVIYTGDTFAIPVKSKNIDMAKKFIEFFLTDDMQRLLSNESGLLPAVTTVDPATLDLRPMGKDIVNFVKANGVSAGWTSVTPGALGQAFIGPELQKQLVGSQTAQQTGENQQANYVKFTTSNP